MPCSVACTHPLREESLPAFWTNEDNISATVGSAAIGITVSRTNVECCTGLFRPRIRVLVPIGVAALLFR